MSDAAAVEALFFAALEKGSAAERAAFLDSACGGDAGLRLQVERLLQAHAGVGDFLQTPAPQRLAAAPELLDATEELDASTASRAKRPRTPGSGHGAVEEAALPPSPASRRLGDFRILREVGKGGMGVVYEAEQVSLGRHVALKVLPKQLLLDVRTKQRFEREARAAAKLHHTNIVPVFGLGEHEGLHYYVMQFIQGLGLDEVLDELKRLQPVEKGSAPRLAGCELRVSRREGARAPDVAPSPPTLRWGRPGDRGHSAPSDPRPKPPAVPFAPAEGNGAASPPADPNAAGESPCAGRLSDSFTLSSSVVLRGERQPTYWQSVARVGVQVADALEHAHRQGVLHRDIKPSNLLLDTRGTVWVTDFGLAKADDQQDLTHTGDVFGTLRYLPPEAFEGRADARGDIYSLGLTLYELLCLRPAFDEKERNRLIKQAMTAEPPRLDRLNREVPRDLVTIVHKAIDRDPARRYPSADALAADLQRFIDDEPIQARRASPAERSLRWCRHNPDVAGLLTAVAILLVGVAGVSTVAAFRIAGARDEATRNAQEALEAKENEGVQRELAEARARESRQRLISLHVANGTRLLDDGDLLGALPWLTEALALDRGDGAREERHRTRIAAALAQAPRLVHLWRHDHEVEHAAFSPDGRRIVTASKDHTARVWDASTGEAVTPPLRHGHIVLKAAFSPDGHRVVTASHDATARVWDARSGQPVSPALPHRSAVQDVSFSPDGRRVVTAGTDGVARVWDAATGQPRTPPMKHASWLHSVSFSRDGRHVVTASHDHTARVWDAATGQPTAPPLRHGAAVMSAAFSPDGRRVVTASEDHTARLWDAATSQPAGPPLEHGDRVFRAAFSPDGRYVSTCSYDTTARVWDAATGRAVTPPMPHRNSVRCATFSPDGRYLVTASYDHTARVWEAATGEAVTPPLRHSWLVTTACFSPDGRRVVTASADWTVRLWDIGGRGAAPLTLRHGQDGTCAAFSPDGRSLVTASEDGTARVWSAVSGQPMTEPLRHGRPVRDACFSADGRRVLTAGDDHTARVWDAATGREVIPPLRHPRRVVQASFDPDAGRVLTAGTDGMARIWDAHTGAPLGPPFGHSQRLFAAAFSPDGRRVVTASGDGTARVWDAATGAPRTPPLQHQGAVEAAAFSPDGRRVVTASADYSARVWDAETGRPLTDPLRHGAGVAAASFSPDGRRVVTGSRQGTARVWDAATGAPVTPLLKHGRGQIRVAFSPDGRRLATGGGTYAAQVWDAATGEALGPPLRHRGWVYHVAFSADGRRLATACRDGTARAWTLPGPDPRPLEDLVLLAQVLSTQRVDATDGLVEVEPAAQCRALEELRSRYPADFDSSAPEAVAWHQREAEACLREKNGPAALFHLLHGRWDQGFGGVPPPTLWWLFTGGRRP
jgi:WD40 repeat protein/serine/threonine protein kinase